MSHLAPALTGAALVFWLAAGFILYTYVLYPLLIALWARLRPAPVGLRPGHQPSVSVVVAAYNEARNLEARLENLVAQDYPADRLEFIFVSDGCTDGTPELLHELERRDRRVRVFCLEQNQGKAGALNVGVGAATGELVVFADARQRFAPDVIARLAENFADPAVGSASGELILLAAAQSGPESEPAAGKGAAAAGVAAQVGLYWRYEKWIRRSESTVGSMLGATGAIYAIRRSLWRPLPPGTLLDDFLTPMRLTLGGYRSIFDGRAQAFDRSSTVARQEYRRKVRTLSGNYQAFAFEPGLLLPWRNSATWFQVWSHKAFRLLVPYALIVLLLASSVTPGGFYRLAALAQVGFYALALAGWRREGQGRPIHSRLISLAFTFVTLNLAAMAGLWSFLRRQRHSDLWRKAYPLNPSS